MPDVSVPDAAQALERADYWLTNAPCESAADGVDHDLIADLASALRAALAAAPPTPEHEPGPPEWSVYRYGVRHQDGATLWCYTAGQVQSPHLAKLVAGMLNNQIPPEHPVAAAPPDDEPAECPGSGKEPMSSGGGYEPPHFEGMCTVCEEIVPVDDGLVEDHPTPRAAAGSPPPTPDDRLARLRTINQVVSHQMDVVGDIADSLADRPGLRKALWQVQSEVSQAIELEVPELVPLSAGPPPTNGPTRQQIDELQRLHDAATPAPWRAHDTFLDVGGHTAVVFRGEFDGPNLRLTWLPTFAGGDGWDTERNCWADADLIVAMRNALPDLLSLLASHRPDNDPEHQT